MHWLYFITLVIVSFSTYSIFNRAYATALPPFHIIGLMGLGLLTTAIIAQLTFAKVPIEPLENYTPALLMALCIVGINTGYVLAFANGAPVSLAPAIANVVSMVILVVAGILLFGESISTTKLLGVGLGIASILLITKG